MILTNLKQRFINRRNRRAKRRLTKKPRFLKIWGVLFLILLIPALVIWCSLIYKAVQESNMSITIGNYPIKVLRGYEEMDSYKKGGEEYLEIDYCNMEDQWALSVENEIGGIALGLFTGNWNNGYWCVYDLTNDRLIDEPQADTYYAQVWYRKPKTDAVGEYDIIGRWFPVNKAQADFLKQFYPIDKEDGIARERLDATGMKVTSAYIKDADFIINSYILDGQEYEYPLMETGISVEGYQYVRFDYETDEKWNNNNDGYGSDGIYEICMDSIRNCTGVIREEIREEAQNVIVDFRKDLKNGKVDSDVHNGYVYKTHIYHSGIMDRIKGKSRIVSSVDINGTEYAVVFIYDFLYPTKQIYVVYGGYLLKGILIGIAITFLPALFLYQRRKLNYKVYQYRSNLTDNMAKALKAPLAEISESIDGLRQDDTKDGRYTTEIRERINYMNGLITNLLELSKNDTVTVKERVAFVLTDVIGDEFISRMQEDGIQVVCNGDVKVNANRPLFEKAIGYIIETLCAYSSDRRIQVDAGKKEILFSCQLKEDRMVTAEDLLEPFAKGTESVDERNLRLPVAKSICDANGLRMSISTADDKIQINIVL